MEDQDNSREPDGDRRHADGRECDTLLPVQYYESVAGGSSPSGEFKLFYAILEDALRCYVKAKHCRSGARRAEFIDARTWFYTRGTPHVFSFESVCAFLDLNADYLRARLESLSPSDLPMKRFHARRRQLVRPATHQRGGGGAITAAIANSTEMVSDLSPIRDAGPCHLSGPALDTGTKGTAVPLAMFPL